MKYLLILLLLPVFASAQYPGGKQYLGNDSNVIDTRGAMMGRFINKVFTDTTAANLQRIKYYDGAQIYTKSGGGKLWIRDSTANMWKEIGITYSNGYAISLTSNVFRWDSAAAYLTGLRRNDSATVGFPNGYLTRTSVGTYNTNIYNTSGTLTGARMVNGSSLYGINFDSLNNTTFRIVKTGTTSIRRVATNGTDSVYDYVQKGGIATTFLYQNTITNNAAGLTSSIINKRPSGSGSFIEIGHRLLSGESTLFADTSRIQLYKSTNIGGVKVSAIQVYDDSISIYSTPGFIKMGSKHADQYADDSLKWRMTDNSASLILYPDEAELYGGTSEIALSNSGVEVVGVPNGGVAADSVLVITAGGFLKRRDAASFAGAGGSGVSSITGTANQISASAATGAVTLSTPSVFSAPGTITAATGLTVTTGGATVTAGGLTVTAGGALITAGGLTVTAGTTTLTPLNSTGIVVNSAAGVLSSYAATDHALQVGGATGQIASLGLGTAGQVLKSNGPGSDPSFQAESTGETNTASNLGGGLDNFSSKSGVDLRFNSFLATDFDLVSNVIGIDYANGQAASGSVNGFVTTGAQTFAGAKTMTSPIFITDISTPIVKTAIASEQLILKQTGDDYGETGLIIQNSGSTAGAIFYNNGVDAVDFGFLPNSTVQRNFRMDHRPGQIIAGNTTEFQMYNVSGGGQYFVVGEASAAMQPNFYIGSATTAPTARLHIAAGTATASTAPLKFTSGTLNATAEAGTQEYNGSYYSTKGSGLRLAEGGVIWDSWTDAQNTGTSETDLYSYTTPANTLANNGEKIEFKYKASITDGATTSSFKIYFGGSLINTSTYSSNQPITITGSIIRVSSSVVRCSVTTTSNSGANDEYIEVTGLTLSGTNILKLTGTATGGTGGTGDLVARLGTISWQGVAAN